MCAIIGFISRRNRPANLGLIKAMVEANIARGPHAFGFAWVDGAGTLRCYKQTGRLTDHLALLALVRDARTMIAHVRWATHGDPRENANNHPHPCDGGWMVHNGVVENYEHLVRRHRLWLTSECDSESIALLIEDARVGTRLGKVASAVRRTEGRLAMLGLWRQSLVAVRRGNPLSQMTRDEGLYLATLPTASSEWKPMPDGRASIWCPARRGLRSIIIPVPTEERAAARACGGEQLSLYRGG